MPIIFVVLKKSRQLSKGQLSRLSEFSSNLSVLFIGSVIFPAFIGAQQILYGRIASGTIMALTLILLSLFLERKND